MIRTLSIPIAVSLLALSACNTPQHKPYTPPSTDAQIEPPPPVAMESKPEEKPAPRAAATGQQPMTAPEPPRAESPRTDGEPPMSSAATDVEITDIPVDEDGNPVIEEAVADTNNRPTDQRSLPQQQTGGGSATPGSGQRDDDSGSSMGGTPRVGGGDATPGFIIGAKSDTERRAALEHDLNTRLAKFDELMRRARALADQERAAEGGGGRSGGGAGGRYAGVEDGRGTRENEPPSGRGAGGQADTSSGLGHTPDITGSGREGEFKYAAAGSIPHDLPNARDDDIVARQLREAATRETDPVLREKLWDEYRKYRTGIGR